MSQIDKIAESFGQVFSGTVALAETLPGEIHHGDRVEPDTLKPFGTLRVKETGRVRNSSGVALVAYEANLKIYVLEDTSRTGEILRIWHHYFDRLLSLPAVDLEQARLVLIFPKISKTYEDKKEEFGRDIIVGETAWGLKLSEYQQTIEE